MVNHQTFDIFDTIDKYLMEEHNAIDHREKTTTKKKIFVKITNREEKHYNHQYVDGLNELSEPFSGTGSCSSAGFYFTDIDHVHEFLHYGVNLRVVELPYDDIDFKCLPDGNDKWRANKIILGEKYSLADVETYQFLEANGFDLYANAHKVFRHAIKNDFMEIVFHLLKMYSIAQSLCDVHALRCAIINNNLAAVDLLIRVKYNNIGNTSNTYGDNGVQAYLRHGFEISACYGKIDAVHRLIHWIKKCKRKHYYDFHDLNDRNWLIKSTMNIAKDHNYMDIYQLLLTSF